MNSNYPPQIAVRAAVELALDEDLLPMGDLTAALLGGESYQAYFVSRSDGVLAGRACAFEAFARVDPSVKVDFSADDGDRLIAGEPFGIATGELASILTAERTALNFLCHLSGVASLTAQYVAAIDACAPGRCMLRDTRKTTPGLRALEKAAVRAGGGFNHRANLSDAILIKDNHLGALSVDEAVSRARRLWPGRTIEVECERFEQVEMALKMGVEMVLLDNMSIEELAKCVDLVNGKMLLEASGGVNLSTVCSIASTGVDMISVGALTHSAPVLDIGLDLHPDDAKKRLEH